MHRHNRRLIARMFVGGLLLSATAFVQAESLRAQTVLRVDVDAPPGGDGTSWPQAFADLAEALAVAAINPGPVEVWVAEGTYVPDGGTGDVTRSFDLSGDLRLLGGFAGDETAAGERDPALHESILSGDLLGNDLPGWMQRTDNTRQIVRARDLSAASEIDGFTITGGNADFPGDDFLGGGAIFVERCDLEVSRCVLLENTAGTLEPTLGNFGGAIYVKGSGSLTVDACRFERNRANAGGAIGTIDFDGPLDVVVTGCLFDQNDVPTQSGGAIRFVGRELVIDDSVFIDQHAGYGGAIHTTLAERIEISDCDFQHNTADVRTAAIWLERSDNGDVTPAVLARCQFLDNWTDGGFRGGTIYLEETITVMTSCILRGNFNLRVNPITAAIEGSGTVTVEFEFGHEFRNCLLEDNFAGFIGGMEVIQAGAAFVNCDFVNNRSASTFPVASGIAAGTSSFAVDNTILWGNRVGTGVDDDLPGAGGEPAQLSLTNAALAINHSLVEGWTGSFGGAGNIGDDPLFVDETAGNLRLATGSPAIDAGDNTAVPPELATDLDGNPRIVDGDGDQVAVVDMGVYEFGGEVVAVDAQEDDLAPAMEMLPIRSEGGRVMLRYRLGGDFGVLLSIFDVRGRLLRVLVNERQGAGEHQVNWDGTSQGGRRLSSGLYFVRLKASTETRTDKIVLLR